jgi:hypothetical protein
MNPVKPADADDSEQHVRGDVRANLMTTIHLPVSFTVLTEPRLGQNANTLCVSLPHRCKKAQRGPLKRFLSWSLTGALQNA